MTIRLVMCYIKKANITYKNFQAVKYENNKYIPQKHF